MSQMKKLQPLIQGIRDKHKNDRKRMNEEIMRLHRTYNINPLGGCLPMLVQIPVFFALYRMLDLAIELRHAPFIGWINDLSAPDRLFHFNFSIPNDVLAAKNDASRGRSRPSQDDDAHADRIHGNFY
jgi:YidC/Oxa1 family membrane protein insertase